MTLHNQQISNLLKKLDEMKKTRPTAIFAYDVVVALAPKIKELKLMGFTYKEIYKTLNENGDLGMKYNTFYAYVLKFLREET